MAGYLVGGEHRQPLAGATGRGVAPPCPQTSAGALSSLAFDPVEGCYGYADSGSGFGRNPKTTAVQAAIFGQNLPVGPGDLTVIWLGSLTCPAYLRDGSCADGRVYDTEGQELQGLELAQRRTDVGVRVHVVIANSGPSSDHAEQVAQLIAAHRTSFGRVVVIGGDESRARDAERHPDSAGSGDPGHRAEPER